MSNRLTYELEALEQLLPWLEAQMGCRYRIGGEHVPVPGRALNCDYLLLPANAGEAKPRLYVEMVRIVDDASAVERRRHCFDLWRALKAECSRVGIEGYAIQTPFELAQSKRVIDGHLAPRIVAGLQRAIAASPESETFLIEGCEFRREPNLRGVGPYAFTTGWTDHEKLSAGALDVFVDKDRQLEFSGDCKRILVAVPYDTLLEPTQLIHELALRPDLKRLPNVDEIVWAGRKSVDVIYTRAVRDYFDHSAPWPSQWHVMVDAWFQSRLTARVPGTFELAKERRESIGGWQFLSLWSRRALANYWGKGLDATDFPRARWLLEELRHDADPADDGVTDNDVLVTVRGAAAFLAHQLCAIATEPELSSLLDVVQDFASDRLSVVRGTAGWAYSVLLRRREQATNGRPALAESLSDRIRDDWLRYLVDASGSESTVRAARTLRSVRRLSEGEVARVLATLDDKGSDSEWAESLTDFLLYFAVSRPQAPDLPPFDGTVAREELVRRLAEAPGFRTQVAYAILEGAENQPEADALLNTAMMDVLREAREESTLIPLLQAMTILVKGGELSTSVQGAFCSALGRLEGAVTRTTPILGHAFSEFAQAALAASATVFVVEMQVVIRGTALGSAMDHWLGLTPTKAAGTTGNFMR